MTDAGAEYDAIPGNGRTPAGPAGEEFFLDSVPEYVIASMQVRDRWFAAAGASADGEAFVIDDVLRWTVGDTLRVAFQGGDTALHRDIENATKEITEACDITLDFGFDPATGAYRTWSSSDTEYHAEIRVSFDKPGYFSLVGRDSVSPFIGAAPGSAIGGSPNQCTLNLGGFTIQRPPNHQGVVRHEFLHAVAFQHEHQHPTSGCELQFRWEDDPGYVPTRDENGRYVPDPAGHRPGIYTYLAGYPNFWSKEKVDHNLRPLRPEGLLLSGFDQASVMLYRFPALFYRSNPSPCAPVGNGIDLSAGDVAGLLRIYPKEPSLAAALSTRRRGVVDALLRDDSLHEQLRSSIENLALRR